MLARVLTSAREDVDAALAHDPAARSRLEVALLYPGVHALWCHRLAHVLWARPGCRLLARAVSTWARRRTGVEIHPAARIGRGVFIDHGMGVVVGETAFVGDRVRLFHGVTLGGTGTGGPGERRHPRIEDDVLLGAGARVIGPVVVGAGARVGAGAVVVRDVPPGAVAVGVPARILGRPQTG